MKYDIIVYGRAYIPDYDSGESRTNILRYSEMTPSLADSMIGLPVYIEHDERYKIGEVVKANVDTFRCLYTHLKISGNQVVNERLPDTLAKDPVSGERYYTGLSLGTDVQLDTKSKCYTTVVGVKPTEVSIVRVPDRTGADIIDYWLVPKR